MSKESLRATITRALTASEKEGIDAENQGRKPRKNPKDIPLGTGLAERARTRLATRGRSIDDAVDKMQ